MIRRVAALAVTHGNPVALAAVPAEIEPEHMLGAFRGLRSEHRRTAYDLEDAERRDGASGDPRADEMAEPLRRPPAPAVAVADAESPRYAG